MTQKSNELHKQFMNAVAEIGIKGSIWTMPIFFSVPYCLRFEICGDEDVYLSNDNGPNPVYVHNALIRAKTLYDNLPYKPDVLRINTYPNEVVTSQSVTLQVLKDMGLPAPDDVAREVVLDDENNDDLQEVLYWDLGKCALPIDKLFTEIIQGNLGGLIGLTGSVYFINSEHYILFHLYDDQCADVAAANKNDLFPLYNKYGSWIPDYAQSILSGLAEDEDMPLDVIKDMCVNCTEQEVVEHYPHKHMDINKSEKMILDNKDDLVEDTFCYKLFEECIFDDMLYFDLIDNIDLYLRSHQTMDEPPNIEIYGVIAWIICNIYNCIIAHNDENDLYRIKDFDMNLWRNSYADKLSELTKRAMVGTLSEFKST